PLYSERVLELNASDERGINVIREKVKTFAHLAVSSGTGMGSSGKIPPYKLIVLDEADSMTAPAQAALRRTMETETRTTRFCLTCNYVTRIIDPITSRCAKFRFRPLDNEVARDRLRHICDAERLDVEDEVLDHVLQLSHGDLRRAITMLQSVCQLWHPASRTDHVHVTEDHLNEVAAVVPDKMINSLLKAATAGRFDDLQLHIKNILLEGHSAHQALYQLHTIALENETLTDDRKGPLLEALASFLMEIMRTVMLGVRSRGSQQSLFSLWTFKDDPVDLYPGGIVDSADLDLESGSHNPDLNDIISRHCEFLSQYRHRSS
ncbi:replication factor C subunit 2/4, partial [Clonorchis sinensis]